MGSRPGFEEKLHGFDPSFKFCSVIPMSDMEVTAR